MSDRNIGASVRDRLLNKARAEKQDYNLLLTRYALERILYRLSISGRKTGLQLSALVLRIASSGLVHVDSYFTEYEVVVG